MCEHAGGRDEVITDAGATRRNQNVQEHDLSDGNACYSHLREISVDHQQFSMLETKRIISYV